MAAVDLKRKRPQESTANSDGSKKKKARLDTDGVHKAATGTDAAVETSNKTICDNATSVLPTSKPHKVKVKKKPALPHTPQEISANWKQLLQSGKVVCTTKKKLSIVSPKSNKELKQKTQISKQPATNSTLSTEKPATKSTEIWFDDVDQIFLEPTQVDAGQSKNDPLVKPYSYEGVTKVIGMDCEMVGVGEDGKESILARVSLVNQYGRCVYDKFVKPTERVIDYRTRFSGVRPSDLKHAEEFKTVQKEVSDLLLGRILVGHALHNDLRVLFLTHPRKDIRDTSAYKPFRQLFKGGTPSLKKLTDKLLAVKVQEGEHNSVQDAQAAMRLYTMYRKEWEKTIKQRSRRPRKNSVSDSVKSDS